VEQPHPIDPAIPASPPPDPAAREPASVPDAAAAGALFDTAGEPTREFVLASLRAAIERKLPGQKLSSEEYDQLAEAVLRMRSVQQQLRGVPPTAENAERLRALREELATAAGDFEYVLEMSPAEFTAQVQPDAGIDEADPDEADSDEVNPESSEPEYLEDLRRD
jgi:DNA-binding transcriptional ArsR family regulator